MPEQIKYRDITYIYDYKAKDYYEKGFNGRVAHSLFGFLFSSTATDDFINDEVEIIEEDKEIEEVVMYQEKGDTLTGKNMWSFYYKINELAREVNKINKQLNK